MISPWFAAQVPEALAAGRAYDVVLMDISMRRVCGDVACATLRAAGATLPILAVSGNAEGAGDDLMRHGFTAALGKPFTIEALRDALVTHAGGGAVGGVGGGGGGGGGGVAPVTALVRSR
jgi:CheY-like chemotaxis protein